jgi:hypothetical protein
LSSTRKRRSRKPTSKFPIETLHLLGANDAVGIAERPLKNKKSFEDVGASTAARIGSSQVRTAGMCGRSWMRDARRGDRQAQLVVSG